MSVCFNQTLLFSLSCASDVSLARSCSSICPVSVSSLRTERASTALRSSLLSNICTHRTSSTGT